MSSPAMKCPNCGLTAKSLGKSDSQDCPDCGEELDEETTRSRFLLMKDE